MSHTSTHRLEYQQWYAYRRMRKRVLAYTNSVTRYAYPTIIFSSADKHTYCKEYNTACIRFHQLSKTNLYIKRITNSNVKIRLHFSTFTDTKLPLAIDFS